MPSDNLVFYSWSKISQTPSRERLQEKSKKFCYLKHGNNCVFGNSKTTYFKCVNNNKLLFLIYLNFILIIYIYLTEQIYTSIKNVLFNKKSKIHEEHNRKPFIKYPIAPNNHQIITFYLHLLTKIITPTTKCELYTKFTRFTHRLIVCV